MTTPRSATVVITKDNGGIIGSWSLGLQAIDTDCRVGHPPHPADGAAEGR